MRDRYDLFGSLPDVIEDDWIENIEQLDEYLSQFTEKKRQANAFDPRYAETVQPSGPGWSCASAYLLAATWSNACPTGWWGSAPAKAAFDVVNADPVQRPGDRRPVGDAEIDAVSGAPPRRVES